MAGDIRDKDDNIFPMVYNTETGKYKYFNSQEDNDLLICCIDNEGNLYGSAPGTSSPVRDWRVCVDNVWYPFDLILKQRYGIEYSDYTGYDNTGTLWSASADTKTLSSMVSPQGESYVVTMHETMTEACRAINLLNNYTATPAACSNFSNVAVVKITFTHEITVLGNKDCAVLKSDKDIYGTTTPIQAYCDRQVFNGTLTMGDVNRREAYIEFTDAAGEPITAEGEYRIEIPAGVFGNKAWYDSDCLSGACNAATTLYYTVGKEATEITYTADPANGSKVDALGTVTIDNNTTSIMASSGQIVIYKDGKELKKVEAEVVYKDPNDFNEVSHKATVAVNATEKGVYTIEIPEGYFVDENGDNIPAVTLTYYVGVASGIQNINAAIANGTVYNLNGVKVNKANKGIFIVNGKKVAKK